MPYDISIVLNVHNEGELICPTLRSLGETIAHAGNHGLKSELVIVLDNPDAATRRVIDTYDFALFKSVKKETIWRVRKTLFYSQFKMITH
ncbi:hypothetical protein AA0472_2804 [Acetobacter estunensis NRIC 0472]|uniref:Glycosyltransferase 2-like domain-containing protein n=1 Tax=Acetobacter estunensis TaxID=104097 RepID=A0A967EBI9_9PROT|nr:hypothetical protein [Acetobacter estunensis]NHO53528.1 hypothetical protein [Acetobacter estunensis]GBQ28814.1 hypothetical protein AA0472_2804 [Acetobacter estunensis NRIC 0472]